MIKSEVYTFYKTPRPNVPMSILHELYQKEYHRRISLRYFQSLSKKITSVKTVRTGAVEIKLDKLSATIAERAFYGVFMYNTVSIDEKPFIPKQYLVRSARVLKDSKEQIYKSLLYALKNKLIYIIAAVNCRGVMQVKILDDPVTKDDFEAFLVHLAYNHRADYRRFLYLTMPLFISFPKKWKIYLVNLIFLFQELLHQNALPIQLRSFLQFWTTSSKTILQRGR